MVGFHQVQLHGTLYIYPIRQRCVQLLTCQLLLSAIESLVEVNHAPATHSLKNLHAPLVNNSYYCHISLLWVIILKYACNHTLSTASLGHVCGSLSYACDPLICMHHWWIIVFLHWGAYVHAVALCQNSTYQNWTKLTGFWSLNLMHNNACDLHELLSLTLI